MSSTLVLIVPGYRGSGLFHWQSLWEASDPDFHRVTQRDWETPCLVDWIEALQQAVFDCVLPPVVVAHSLGCALVAHWATIHGHGVKAALLVSPSDVDSPAHTPAAVRGFSPMPLLTFPFPSIVVASNNDPRVELKRAEMFAMSWGSRLVVVERAGHINEDSGLGDWAAGKALLRELMNAP
ncbi:serine hydrolase family protein [Cupriavidus necator]|uniref:Serine hydrolase family protein n=1 Tax=Cupriavidus necator TaxID=106590 RepID=A0A1U9UVR4_CUPNE|nr:alpha/beta hydrolase [Cupriavidus necator]AQV96772.1 serine hydrolase family protein [Cupriavidus necator]